MFSKLDNLVEYIFEVTKDALTDETSFLKERYEDEFPIEVPLTQDIYGDTALDIILGARKNYHRLASPSAHFFHCRKTDAKFMKLFRANVFDGITMAP